MNAGKLNTFEGLRLAALGSKGYTANQIASLQDIFTEINTSLLALEEHASSPHAPANAEENVIIGIKRNGTFIAIQGKVADISVPTKTSDLVNDSGFATESDVSTAVNGAGHLKSLVVDELPDTASAAANTLYYLRKNDGEPGNQYDEYQLINGVFERVGMGSVNIDDYATKASVEKANSTLITSIFNTLSASSEKYVGTGNLASFWNLVKPLITTHENSINDLIARVELLELILNSEVEGNPFYVTFTSLSGLSVSGVWNTADGRVEF